MIELTEDQRQQLGADPLRVVDPLTRKTYVLVSEEQYERVRDLLVPERLTRLEQRALLQAAGKRAGWDDPEMDVYDDEQTSSEGAMNLQRGDVVMVDWLYSDRTGSKRRPALVVQADAYNQVLDDTILAMITASVRRKVGAATQLDIDISTPDGQKPGLIIDSVVQCENLVTVDKQFVLSKRGQLSATFMQQIDDCLKAALQLQ